MKPSEQLAAARELISVPERWTQGEFARNAWGDCVSVDDEAATCFCSMGALDKIYEEGGIAAYLYLVEVMDHNIYNDTHTHSEVFDMFSKAIALAQSHERQIYLARENGE